MNDTQWTSFCNSHLKRFERKWTTKLEDYKDGKLIDDSDSEESDDNIERGWKDADDFSKPKSNGSGRPNSGKTRYPTDNNGDDEENDDDDERFLEKMLDQGMKKRQEITKRDGVHIKPSRDDKYKVEDKNEEDQSFYANTYWHKPDVLHESLDELLKSEGFDL